MANGLPAPPTADQQVTDVPASPRERILSGIGGVIHAGTGQGSFADSPLAKQMDADHAKRVSMAQLHQKNYATATRAILTGEDPETGEKIYDPQSKQVINQDRWQYWQHIAEAEKGEYQKAAGTGKGSKDLVQRHTSLIDHLHRMIGGGQPQQAPTSGGGGAPAPASPQTPTAGLPPPPSAPSTSPVADDSLDRMSSLQNAQTRQATQAELDTYQKKVAIDQAAKEAEERAKAANKPSPKVRPVQGKALTVLDARALRDKNKADFVDQEGHSISLDNLPDTMSLNEWQSKDDAGHDVTFYVPFSPNQKMTVIGNRVHVWNPGDVSKAEADNVVGGPKSLGTNTVTQDPVTGLSTKSSRTPVTEGGTPSGGASSGSKRGSLPSPPTAQSTTPSAGGKSTGSAQTAPLNVITDEDGHIPVGANVEVSPGLRATTSVIEAANQLIDDHDVDKIPTKVRELGAALARQTGWFQGKFTPAEMNQIRIASRYVDDLISNPAMKSLDRSFFRQLPMLGASGDPNTEGQIGKIVTKLSSMATTPEQREFLRSYRQVVGTIAGLGKLTRSARITKADIDRLMSELPNPNNTADSQDAIQRMKRLQDEIQTALLKGKFVRGDKKSVTPALPKAGDTSSSKSADDEIMSIIGGMKPKPH